MKGHNQFLPLNFLLSLLIMTTFDFCFAQQKTRILFLLDGSYSMKNNWKGGTKWATAISSLSDIADSISQFPDVEMGLRVFGHLYPEPENNCKDSRLEVAIDSNNAKRIKKRLEEIKPKGITPIVYSIEKSASDFGSKPGKNILIIITDGEEACEGDPCSVALTLQKNHIVLRPFIIGMQLQSKAFEKMNCIGKFYNTTSSEEFSATLQKVVIESIAKTTLQVDLNDMQGKPTETDVNMTFYDQETGIVKYNYYHSMNTRGVPDTITLSPMFKYKLQVHTIPPIIKEDIELIKNKHTVVNISAPQGYLNFILQGMISKSSAVDRIKCLLHKPGEIQTLNVQKINSKEKYITGTYELEVLTLPRMIIKDVKISQSKTTDVQIPAPGILTISKTFEAYGGIFVVEGKKMRKIYELKLNSKQETIALQPGKYRIVYRSKNSRSIHTTVDKEFEINSGGSVSLKL